MPATNQLPRQRQRKKRRSYEGPSCPNCARTLTAQERVSGRGSCRSCGVRYQATAFTPPADPGALVLPVGATGGGSPCAKHARNAAEVSCSRCGSFMCQLCRVDSDGLALCPGCFDRLAGEGALPSVRRTYRDLGALSLILALVGIPFLFFGALLGPCAIWFAVRGLKQSRQPGVTISRARCVVALILGVGEAVFGVFIILSMAGAFK